MQCNLAPSLSAALANLSISGSITGCTFQDYVICTKTTTNNTRKEKTRTNKWARLANDSRGSNLGLN